MSQQNTPTPHKRKKSRRRSATVTTPNTNVNDDPNTPSQPISKSKRKSSSKSKRKSIDPSTPTFNTSSSSLSSRHRSNRNRSNSDALHQAASRYRAPLNEEDEFNLGAAYNKGDIVTTKDHGEHMCVIKSIRNSNGLQYGIVIPDKSNNMQYIKPPKIKQKIAPETVITRITSLERDLVCHHHILFCDFAISSLCLMQ